MIVADDSPLLRLRGDLAPEQASFFDGIRICGQMLDVAYLRLGESLWDLSLPRPLSEKRVIQTASIMLDAWAIIDSVHRLRDLLDQLPRLKKSSPKYQSFTRTTEAASNFRNTIQHLRGELIDMGKNGWPAWGTLSWLAVTDAEKLLVRSCTLIPGRVQTYKQTMINPLVLTQMNRVDFVLLQCKAESVNLTKLYEQSASIIHGIEPSLRDFVEDKPTLAADLVVIMDTKINPSM